MVPRQVGLGRSFKGAGAYYLHDKDADTSERVAFTHTENIPTQDPEKALKWMAWTATNAEELKRESGAKATGGVALSFLRSKWKRSTAATTENRMTHHLAESLSSASFNTPTIRVSPGTSELTDRVCIRVYRDASWRYVYIETSASGEQTFWDEEPGEVRRYQCAPSTTERQVLLDAAHACISSGCPPYYVDLNVPPGSLNAAGDVSLAAFRKFVHDRGDISDAISIDRTILTFLRTIKGSASLKTTNPRTTSLSPTEVQARLEDETARQEAA